MTRSASLRLWSRALGAAAALSLSGAAQARSNGVVALGCDSCHSGGKAPSVTLTATPEHPGIGEPVTLTIGVSQANGSTAGFYLTTTFAALGAFKAVDTGTTATSSGVMHSMPRVGSGGTTTFKAQWTATSATGVAFEVFALSANGDKRNQGDGAGVARLELAAGCTGTTYFLDQDGDGYGTTDPAFPPRLDCSQPTAYAPEAGDCDDFRASIHPGALEQCDLKDNDCNGKVDDDVVNQAFCLDQDGDGHGQPGGETKLDCKPSAGFGECDGDCDDRDPKFYPGAVEVCDLRDNDCDGQVDEEVRPVCGVGLCARIGRGCGTDCTPGTPFVETCNGYDDDCDGVVDNGDNTTLCGDANVPCVDMHCLGQSSSAGAATTGGTSGSGPGSGTVAGSPSAGGNTGLPRAGSTGACALGGRSADCNDLVALALVALAWRRRRLSRAVDRTS